MDNYRIIEKIGEGAHGIVLKAIWIKTGTTVALKKVPLRNSNELPNPIIREIKSLQLLKHQNIVECFQVFPSGSGFVLVFEYIETDLSEIIKSRISNPQKKYFMKMMLRGISYCHKNSILHRDLKPANVLISKDGKLKLADFGLSRCKSTRPLSHQVATRWYRSPELLYGAREYDEGIDLWAIGCIFGELLNQSPLFPGQNDIDQLYKVQSVLGSPDPLTWPECSTLPDYDKIEFPDLVAKEFDEICPDAPPEALRLLKRFLVYKSSDRIRADDALLDEYFYMNPLPRNSLELPLKRTHEFDIDQPIDFSLYIKAT